MQCQNCQKNIDNDAKFCRFCGAAINAAVSTGSGSVDAYFAKKEESITEEVRKAARGEMIKGVLWFLAAGVITFVTYAAADEGGTYFVFWGAMIYGVYRLIRGLYYFSNPAALIEKAKNQQG